jgi:hypothetical protein
MTGGTRPFEAFSPFFDEVFRFFIFVFIFVEVGRSVAGDVVVCQDRLLLSVLQAADPAICATLEGWADRQVLLVCELHRRAQQVVNADGVQENLNRSSGVLRTIFEAFLFDLGCPGCAKPVCWDGIEPLLIPFVMTDKVEGVHGESVSLLIVFRGVRNPSATSPYLTRIFILENPYEFLQFFHAWNFREELIDNLLRNVRHEC